MNHEKTKILLVIRWPVGGIRTYLRYVYGKFDPIRYSITMLVPEVFEIPFLMEDLKKQKITLISLSKIPNAKEFMLRLFSLLRKEKFDVIHSHGLTAGLYTLFPAIVFRIPHLVTIHDQFLRNQFRGLQGKAKKMFLFAAMPLFTRIHAVSNDVKENLIEFILSLKVLPSKITVINNGIETERFVNATALNLRKEFSLPNNSFLIGFLGRFMSQKGFVYLVEAMETLDKRNDLKKTPIVLAFGEGGFIREEKAAIEKKGLKDSIRFLPFTSNIAPVLKGLDLVVMPSLWEACPLMPMEALVAGVPLIGTNCLGLREVLKETPCVMVPVKNSIALAEAIYQEMKNPSKDAAEGFREKAVSRFDVKNHCLALNTLLHEIIRN